jgi:hypothetical protein
VFFIVRRLKGLPDSVFPQAILQACVFHLIHAHDFHLAVRLP